MSDRKILVREIDYDDTDYILLHSSDKIIATHAMKYDDGTKFYIIIEEMDEKKEEGVYPITMTKKEWKHIEMNFNKKHKEFCDTCFDLEIKLHEVQFKNE